MTEQTPDQAAPVSRLLHLAGSAPLFPEELRVRVEAGARLVRFEWCVSLLIVTIRCQSSLYVTESWQERYLRGLGYSALALVLGLWGVPWGLIMTPRAIWINLTGGIDETATVLAQLESIDPTAEH